MTIFLWPPILMSITERIPTDPHQRRAWVLYQLKLRGMTFASIAEANGWSRTAVRQAMFLPSYPQEVAVAEALDLEPQQLFPERYDAKGRRLHQILGSDRNRNVARPKGAAA